MDPIRDGPNWGWRFPHVSYLPHWRPIVRTVPICRTVDVFRRSMLTAGLRGHSQQFTALEENYRDENCDCGGCNACPGDCRWRGRPPAPAARLSNGSSRQDADWQSPDWQGPDRQGTRRVALLVRGLTEIWLI